MTAYDSTLHARGLHARGSGILRLLRLGGRRDDPAPMPATLGEIARFLDRHQLDVTPLTLAAAYDVVTGADLRLARLIDQEHAAGHAVTHAWLENVRNLHRGDDGAGMIGKLMDRLDQSLHEFTHTTRAARSATSDYNASLATHLDEIEQASTAGAVISELARIARLMIERTRAIEAEMQAGEQRANILRASLEEARRSADIDHLTGLPNRRAFEAVFAGQVDTARQLNQPICVALCDIDHFKRVNDMHGHDAGDRVLRVVAQALAALADDTCHVARHGGEEFIVLMRGRTIDQAWAEIDAVRAAMAERQLVNRATDAPFGRITFSAGLADVLAFPDPSDALKAADDALYDAKSWGRNCVIRADAQGQNPLRG